MTVTVDPRVELLAIAQGLSSYPYQSIPLTLAYGQELREHFAGLENHELIRFIHDRWERGFGFDAPVVLALSLDPGDYSRYIHAVPREYRDRAGGQAGIERFAALMASFAATARFGEFVREHRPEYESWVREFASGLAEWEVRGRLEKFYGVALPKPTVVLSGVMQGPQFGPLVGAGGEATAYVVMGRTSERGVDGRLEPSFRVSAGTVRALYHELSHSVVNPLLDAHAADVAARSSLAEPLRARLAPMGYPDWNAMLGEHIVLAVETYLAFEENPAQRESALDRYEELGFEYIRSGYGMIERYGAGRGGAAPADHADRSADAAGETGARREEYTDFAAFLPVLLEELPRWVADRM